MPGEVSDFRIGVQSKGDNSECIRCVICKSI
jgi:hypothetical protein